MPTLAELHAQKAELESQIAAAQTAARDDAIATITSTMQAAGLTFADLADHFAPIKRKPGAQSGSKVEPKYRDPATGDTWSGRGLRPRWLTAHINAGRRLEDFAAASLQ